MFTAAPTAETFLKPKLGKNVLRADRQDLQNIRIPSIRTKIKGDLLKTS